MDYLRQIFPGLIEASGTTLSLFFWSFLFALPLGWILSLVRVSKNKIAQKISWAYCWVLRGTPLALQMTFLYFGVASRLQLLSGERYIWAVTALVLNYAAYYAEIFRGGILSIDSGQLEAADILGFSNTQSMIRIIMPQAIKNVLPSIGNETISLVKDTSLVYWIGMSELIKFASNRASADFRMEPFLGAAIIYLFLTFILTQIMALIERRFNYYH